MLKAKRYLILVFVVVIVGALALPVQAQEGEPVIQALPCKEPGKLTMWIWETAWEQILLDSFEAWKTNYCPGAEVELQINPWDQYWVLLRTSAAGGELPDVFNMNQTFFPFYAENDAILNLQPYWDEFGVDTTVWGSGLVGPYRVGEAGDLYAAPLEWVTAAVYYNKDMFDAAGLSYPTADWTWDDFAADAETLTDPDNDVYGAAAYVEYQAGFANWIASTGETPVVDAARTDCTLDNPGSLEALNFLKDLYDQGFMPSTSTMGGANADDAFNFWASGKVAMIGGGAWKLSDAMEQVTFNWDVVQFPKHPETGRSRAIVHAASYVASAGSANPDLAANLILFLASDEGQKFFAEGGSVAPANPSPVLQQLWIDTFGESEINIQAFVDATVDSQGITAFDEIWNAINTELVVQIFDLDVSVEDAVATTCEAIAPYLSQ